MQIEEGNLIKQDMCVRRLNDTVCFTMFSSRRTNNTVCVTMFSIKKAKMLVQRFFFKISPNMCDR